MNTPTAAKPAEHGENGFIMDKANSANDNVTFESNAVRLTVPDWLIVAAVLLAVAYGLPIVWTSFERFSPDDGYRMPYSLSEDYWHFTRYARRAVGESRIIVLGDSVMWGKFAFPGETLSNRLNAATGIPFWNLGINGLHPVAFNGLMRYYGTPVRNQTILLHFNPLWMCSPQNDLSAEREFRFNHPGLVPQFWPKIPCYHEPAGMKAGVVAARYVPLRGFANHLSVSYYDNKTAPAWALEHPYESLFHPLLAGLPEPGAIPHNDLRSWTERGMTPQPFEWADPDTSLQWRFFREAVVSLRSRGNTLFVIVGPFNKHAVAEASQGAYEKIITTARAWLEQEQLPHYIAATLPSELYADVSHPLGGGYALLAEQLLAQDAFRMFLDGAVKHDKEAESRLVSEVVALNHEHAHGEL